MLVSYNMHQSTPRLWGGIIPDRQVAHSTSTTYACGVVCGMFVTFMRLSPCTVLSRQQETRAERLLHGKGAQLHVFRQSHGWTHEGIISLPRGEVTQPLIYLKGYFTNSSREGYKIFNLSPRILPSR